MTSQWKKMVDQAKSFADTVSDDPRAKEVVKRTRSGAVKAAGGLDAARRTVTQEETWAEVTNVIEEIIDVVIAQQAVIDELVRRVGIPTEYPE